MLLLCVEGDGDGERGCGGMCVGAGDESVCVLDSVCMSYILQNISVSSYIANYRHSVVSFLFYSSFLDFSILEHSLFLCIYIIVFCLLFIAYCFSGRMCLR